MNDKTADRLKAYIRNLSDDEKIMFMRAGFDQVIIWLYNRGRWDLLDSNHAKAKRIYRGAHKRLADRGDIFTDEIIYAKATIQRDNNSSEIGKKST